MNLRSKNQTSEEGALSTSFCARDVHEGFCAALYWSVVLLCNNKRSNICHSTLIRRKTLLVSDWISIGQYLQLRSRNQISREENGLKPPLTVCAF